MQNRCHSVSYREVPCDSPPYQALQARAAAGPGEGPEAGDEVHHRHHRGTAQELPSVVSDAQTH